MTAPIPYLLDLVGVAVFAVSGGLVASRKQLDLIGFGLMASLAGIGGGTVRDLIIDRPVFWIADQPYLIVCLAAALAVYLLGPRIERRYVVLLWADAIGLAAFGVLGAHIAMNAGLGPVP
ncbi:MAG: trimeric intracellular cation channel family protein, partial [Inquilinus sp.]|nr:trimeric intracellular cation channel family protein [Inquilinus sp.]